MAESSIPNWLSSLPLAPVFSPSPTDFADPISYLSRIHHLAAPFGICKVIPPLPNSPKSSALNNLYNSLSNPDNTVGPTAVFTTRHQELGRSDPCNSSHQQVWQSGQFYTLSQFEAKSKSFSKTYLGNSKELNPLLVESKFWRAVSSDKPIYVEYANDVPGSGFSRPDRRRKKRRKGEGGGLSDSAWNLQVIARADGSLTKFMPDEVPGVTSPMVYIGMLFSWFAWHVEDHELHSMNFLHVGAPKTWYAVPGDFADAFEEIVRVQCYGSETDRLASLAMLGEKTNLLSPEVVAASGVPCCRLVQHPGEFVVTFPRAYHVGFSHGFNCGEAANFATPQWLKVAKDAAVRRAAMNYLPMLSHQQLLYMLALSFVSSASQAGARNSRSRDRKREEREVTIKREFLDDLMKEDDLLFALLAKVSISHAVLWEPELLPSTCAVSLSQCSLPCEAEKLMSVDDNVQKRMKDQDSEENIHVCEAGHSPVPNTSEVAADLPNITDSNLDTQKILTNDDRMDPFDDATVNTDVDDGDLDDLPFGLNVDSGSLACVSCGILSYPFMAIIQPCGNAVKNILSFDSEESNLKPGEPQQSSNTNSCQPCTFEKFSSDKEVYCGRSSEQNMFYLRSKSSHSGSLASVSKRLNDDGHHLPQVAEQPGVICEMASGSMPSFPTEPSDLSTSCVPANSAKNEKNEDAVNLDLNFLERINSCIVPEENCCHEFQKWNTSNGFLRPRSFCLQHALEVAELLQSKGGAHVLIICHSDYLKIKALAIAIAEEITVPINCKDVPLEHASSSDLDLINISIDDERHIEEGNDWTSKLGLNLKYCVKVRKQSTSNQEPLTLSLGGILSDPPPVTLSSGRVPSDPSPVSSVSHLKWLSKKSRTTYQVVASVITRPVTNGNLRKDGLLVENCVENSGTACKVYNNSLTGSDSRYESNSSQYQNTLMEESVKDGQTITFDSSDEEILHANAHSSSCNSEDNFSNQLFTIPIVVADYPQVHQVSWLASRISSSDDACSVKSDCMPPHTSLDIKSGKEFSNSSSDDLSSKVVKLDPMKPAEEVQLSSFKFEFGSSEKSEMLGDKRTIILDVTDSGSISDRTLVPYDSSPNLVSREIFLSLDNNHPEVDVKKSLLSEDQCISAAPLLDVKEAQLEIRAKKGEASMHGIIDHPAKSMDPLSASDDNESQKERCPVTVDLFESEFVTIDGNHCADDLLLAVGDELQHEGSSCNDDVKVDVKISGEFKNNFMKQPGDSQTVNERFCLQESNDNTSGLCNLADKPYSSPVSWQTNSRYPPGVDLIPYVRRKNKRKREEESGSDCKNNFINFVRSPCEGLRPRNIRATNENKDISTVEKKVSLISRNKVGDSVPSKSKENSEVRKSFKCNVEGCSMSFDTRVELSLHRKNRCTYEGCGKRFRSHKYTVRHLRVHNDDRPLKCPWKSCNMTFKWAWARTEHIRVHTGERPYECKVSGCGQTFRYVSDYSRHRRKTGHYITSLTG